MDLYKKDRHFEVIWVDNSRGRGWALLTLWKSSISTSEDAGASKRVESHTTACRHRSSRRQTHCYPMSRRPSHAKSLRECVGEWFHNRSHDLESNASSFVVEHCSWDWISQAHEHWRPSATVPTDQIIWMTDEMRSISLGIVYSMQRDRRRSCDGMRWVIPEKSDGMLVPLARGETAVLGYLHDIRNWQRVFVGLCKKSCECHEQTFLGRSCCLAPSIPRCDDDLAGHVAD
jgi:hypothetical protein